jgi:peptide subunit release factor 1 (eRF1)
MTDTFSVDFLEERSKVILDTLERLLAKEREEVNRQIQGIKERGLKAGMATLGLNGTLEALHRGQIHTLYLSTKVSLMGGKCSRCGALVLIQSDSCPLCKGEIKKTKLVEEMVRQVYRQDGEVQWVEDNPILEENEGVGASLRFHT